MPVQYTIPPWLHPPNWAGAFAQSAELRQREIESAIRAQQQQQHLDQQQQQMQQQFAIAQMKLQAEQQVAGETARRRDAELALKTAYETATIGLRERALNQASRVAEAKIQQTARRASGMLDFQKAFSEAKTPEEKVDAAMRFGPLMGATPDALLRIGLQRSAHVPSSVEEISSGSGRRFMKVTNPNTGAVSLHASDPLSANWTRNNQFREMTKERDRIANQLDAPFSTLSTEEKTAAGKRLRQLNEQIKGMLSPAQDGEDQGTMQGKVDESGKITDEDVNDFLDELGNGDNGEDAAMEIDNGE